MIVYIAPHRLPVRFPQNAISLGTDFPIFVLDVKGTDYGRLALRSHDSRVLFPSHSFENTLLVHILCLWLVNKV